MNRLECSTTTKTTTTKYITNKTKTTTTTKISTTTCDNGSTENPSAMMNERMYNDTSSQGDSGSDTDYSNGIGNVGYKFRKYFPGYGYFDGIVTEIRKGTKDDKNRRCMYSDGDIEDLSLKDLRLLYKTTKRIEEHEEPIIKKPKRAKNNIHVEIECDDIPIDEIAENTIYSKKTTLQDDEDYDDNDSLSSQDEKEEIWLEKVATLLANGGRSNDSRNTKGNSSSNSSSKLSASKSPINNSISSSIGQTEASNQQNENSSVQKTTSLASLRAGTRFGKIVKHIPTMIENDTNYGEVLLDEKGWVEASFGSLMIRDRAKNFLLIDNDVGSSSKIDKPIEKQPQDVTCDESFKIIKKTIVPNQIQNEITTSNNYNASTMKKPPSPNYFTTLKESNIPYPRTTIKSNHDTYTHIPPMNIPTQEQKLSSKTQPKTSTSPPKPTKEKYKLSNFFYWNCHYCTSFNSFLKVNCEICRRPKIIIPSTPPSSPLKFKSKSPNKYDNGGSILSPLLQVVHDTMLKYTNPNDAYENLSFTLRRSIDKKLLQYFYGIRNAGLKTSITSSSFVSIPIIEDKNIKSLDDYFNWSCGYCTFVNSYKVKRCTSCFNLKSYLSECSIMLRLALDVAKEHDNIKTAMETIPFNHKPALPKEIFEFLITCSYVVPNRSGSGMRRCLKPKVPGKQHCIIHLDPFEQGDDDKNDLSSPESLSYDKSKEEQSSSPSLASIATSNNNPISTTNTTISQLLTALHTFLTKQCTKTHTNPKQYSIQSIEDAITLQQEQHQKQQAIIKSPFPLGMKIRRFFTKFGFHDGRIIQIRRNIIYDEALKSYRPVLLYLIKYLDGDEEQFLNYQIISLKQFYDVRNVDSTALPTCQIIPKTIYECSFKNGKINDGKNWIQIISNHTPIGIPNKKEGGLVKVHFYKETTSQHPINNQIVHKMNFNVTDLQVSIVKKCPIQSLENNDFNRDDPNIVLQRLQHNYQFINSPIFEWPKPKVINEEEQNKCDASSTSSTSSPSTTTNPKVKKHKTMIFDGLWLTNTKVSSSVQQEQQLKAPFCSTYTYNNADDIRVGMTSEEIWDPSHTSPYLLWDPYSNIVCEICRSGADEHQMLLCDKCEKGYHMFCLTPIVVNIPAQEWLCEKCLSLPNRKQTFQDMITQLEQTITAHDSTVMKFLNLNHYKTPSDFRLYHEDELSLLEPQNANKRKSILQKKVTKSRTTTKYGSLYVSYGYKESNNEWVLPVPLVDKDLYTISVISIVAAMKFCGMKRYSEELVYAEKELEQMNDCNLDSIEKLNKRNLEIFREFKYNLSRGAFPPIKIVYDEKVGFTVEALAKMPRHTLIAEYVGEVTTVENSEDSSSGSDSLMMLLDSGDSKTSLIIDPSHVGNIARFLSGVNNRCYSSKRKANVRTRRFILDGQSRVALFTSKVIEVGDKLHYDYNSGLQDKQVEDWAKNGFYDTSNFI